jgi:hypothetical protein
VLLEEYPGLLPTLSDRPILRYVLATLILIVVLLVVASIPLTIVVGLVLLGDPQSPSIGAILIVELVTGAVLYWLSMRLALILPATAVGRPMTLGESWRYTARASGAIFVAIVILSALSIGAGFVLDLLLPGGLVRTVFDVVVTWISLMVGVSVMTTLYGHLVERRAID